MTTLSSSTARQLAAQAGRGHLRALTDLLRAIIDGTVTIAGGVFDTITLGGTAITSSAAELNILDGVTATAAEINRACDASARIVTLTADTSITETTHDGKVLLLGEVGGDAALAATLPAATGSGARFRFVVSVVNASGYTIKVADATDVMYGNVVANATGDTPDLAQPWPTAADSDTITLNGATTGGAAIGDWVECIDIATNAWAVTGVVTASGAEATPFSATV
jgi:hypothetical protein